jgi:hypothetical protein
MWRECATLPERGAARAPAEAMILEDLRQVDGWGYRHGLRHPQKRDAHFGAAAGPVRNKNELKQLFEIIIDRLKRLFCPMTVVRQNGVRRSCVDTP